MRQLAASLTAALTEGAQPGRENPDAWHHGSAGSHASLSCKRAPSTTTVWREPRAESPLCTCVAGRGCLPDPRLLECRVGGEAAKTGHSHGQTLKTLTGFFSDNREWWCSQTCLLLTGMKEHTHLWTQMENATNREQNNPPNIWKLTASVKYIKFWQFTWKQKKRKKKKKKQTWLKVGLLCNREHLSPWRHAPILK